MMLRQAFGGAKLMKFIGIGVLALALAAIGGLFYLAQKSKTGEAPGLTGGRLAPCPSSPNCVSSEPGTPESHRADPLPADAWGRLPEILRAEGGEIITQTEDYIAATFTTKLMGYVDDVELRRAADAVHIRSASRVGYGDQGVNAKRAAALLAAASR